MGLPSASWATWCERDGCAKPIGRPAPNRKYCSDTCRVAQYNYRRGKSKPRKPANNVRPGGQARRGPRYTQFVTAGWADKIAAGHLTNAECARQTGFNKGDVSRFMAAYREDTQKKVNAALAREYSDEVIEFAEFRAQFFTTVDRKGNAVPYRTPDFQKRWIKAIDETIAAGERLLILSPPRHGKTEMLIHFVIWRICVQPNIRILWVGLNEDIAKQSVELVRTELETNEDLIRVYGGSTGFAPAHRQAGGVWAAERITVQTRTTALKSPTLTAVGRGGKLLSRDADLIILDDIVDHSTTNSQAQRESDWRWLKTQISSRKEEHTAVVGIGSKQHPEDIYAGLLESRVWRHIVEAAHDEACLLPADQSALHTDCVLFPEYRTYAWLMNMREDLGGVLFDMVYQNRAVAAGARAFTREIVEPCLDHTRRVGQTGRLRLIAGLDPATSGYQAAVLWGVDVETMVRHLIDLDNDRGGGLPGARQIIRDWLTNYGCRHWVIEANNYQGAVRQDLEILRFARDNAVKLEGHFTHGHNKWDPQYGVTAMADLFIDRRIVLPYADMASKAKVDVYVKQLLRFEGKAGGRSKQLSDLVMAAWFPETQIRNWQREHAREMRVEYEQTDYPWTPMSTAWGTAL